MISVKGVVHLFQRIPDGHENPFTQHPTEPIYNSPQISTVAHTLSVCTKVGARMLQWGHDIDEGKCGSAAQTEPEKLAECIHARRAQRMAISLHS